MNNKEIIKKFKEQYENSGIAKYKHMCRCGHSVVIYPFEKRIKKLCSWCGEYVYINEREEFKDKLMKLLGGIKK